jgi:hypothetical protein
VSSVSDQSTDCCLTSATSYCGREASHLHLRKPAISGTPRYTNKRPLQPNRITLMHVAKHFSRSLAPVNGMRQPSCNFSNCSFGGFPQVAPCGTKPKRLVTEGNLRLSECLSGLASRCCARTCNLSKWHATNTQPPILTYHLVHRRGVFKGFIKAELQHYAVTNNHQQTLITYV